MIAKSVVNRSDTDIILSPLWAIAPFVISIASMALGFAIAFYWLAFPSASWMVSDWSGSEIELHSRVIFFVIWLCNLANALILTKLAYNLVWRQGEHFRREHGVVDAVTTMTLQTTGKRVDERLPARDERPRKPVFWAFVMFAPTAVSLAIAGSLELIAIGSESAPDALLILALMVPVVLVSLVFLVLQIYMLYFLMEEMKNHHGRWWRFTVNTKRELAMMGYTAGHLRNPGPLSDRNPALYIVLTLLVPFFSLYWFYALIKDGNSHFVQQKIFENQLVELLRRLPPERSHQMGVTASA